jgi:hypothetical protein
MVSPSSRRRAVKQIVKTGQGSASQVLKVPYFHINKLSLNSCQCVFIVDLHARGQRSKIGLKGFPEAITDIADVSLGAQVRVPIIPQQIQRFWCDAHLSVISRGQARLTVHSYFLNPELGGRSVSFCPEDWP